MKHTLLTVLTFLSLSAHAQIITTIAGGGTITPGDNGPATAAQLNDPIGVAVDANGNFYIAERGANKIRKVNSSGIITTIAGTGAAAYSGDNGPAIDAELNQPYGILADATGNIYFSDDFNHRIRKISATTNIITTIAGNGAMAYSGDNGPATLASINYPGGIAMDAAGNLFIADNGNSRIRKVDIMGIITTIAGNGASGYNGDNIAATNAQLYNPNAVAVDGSGNVLIDDYHNYRIRNVSVSGVITTIAGNGVSGYAGDNGQATVAQIRPLGISIYNNDIYIGDTYNYRVRKVDLSRVITTIAGGGASGLGDGGLATNCELDQPVGVAIDASADIYICNLGDGRVRFIKSTVLVNDVDKVAYSASLYPNPSNGTFNLKVATNTDEPAKITISNITGEVVKVLNSNTNIVQIITLSCPPGMYFLSATTAHTTFTQRIIIGQ